MLTVISDIDIRIAVSEAYYCPARLYRRFPQRATISPATTICTESIPKCPKEI